LLSLCILFWSLCLIVLAYQGILWFFQGIWPAVTLADAVGRFSSLNHFDLIRHLPFEWTIKLAYVGVTTELSLALWWTGVFFCALEVLSKLLRR